MCYAMWWKLLEARISRVNTGKLCQKEIQIMLETRSQIFDFSARARESLWMSSGNRLFLLSRHCFVCFSLSLASADVSTTAACLHESITEPLRNPSSASTNRSLVGVMMNKLISMDFTMERAKNPKQKTASICLRPTDSFRCPLHHSIRSCT